MSKKIESLHLVPELVLKEHLGDLPTSVYELKAGEDTIGILQLRHFPTKRSTLPEGFESHIYYEINPEYRNKGYGTKILNLGLVKAKEAGLQEVILTCDKDNSASQKIIKKNGGVLSDEQLEEGGDVVYKYKITL